MRFGSLFSGFGGMDLGLEWAGHECRWQIENDEYASRVLAKHWPHVTRYGEIREVSFERVEPIELLAGGFPCQDLSCAGKGLGLSGPRSGLWSEFKRAVRVVGPRYVLVENVPGLLGRGMGAVLGDLAALGYDAEWQSLPAAAFGAPHVRWRVFIVAWHVADSESVGRRYGNAEHLWATAGARDASRDSGSLLAYADGQRQQQSQGAFREERRRITDGGSEVADPVGHGVQEPPVFQPGKRPATRSWWQVEPPLDRVVDGFPGRVEQLRGLGNAVVPQVAQYLGELIAEHEREVAA